MSNTLFDKEFKEAISHLPSKEKDKLIIRLLRKNLNLANRLYFELIDDKGVDERRDQLEIRIISRVKQATNTFYSPGYLKMDMGYLSGAITEHVKITKDKFGEAYLNLLLLNEVLQQNNKNIANAPFQKARKCCIYIIAKTFKILMLIQKLHEDFHIEFKEEIQQLGELIGENDYLMRTAIHHGLDVNWLIRFNIPEGIAVTYKDLRANGYLR